MTPEQIRRECSCTKMCRSQAGVALICQVHSVWHLVLLPLIPVMETLESNGVFPALLLVWRVTRLAGLQLVA